MHRTILFVGEDDSALQSLPQPLLGNYPLSTSRSYKQALIDLKKIQECGLVIIEHNLDGKDCRKFLKHLKLKYPKAIRLLLTTQGQFSQARKAIDDVETFQLIEKPYPPEILLEIISKSMEQYIRHEKKQKTMRQTLLGSVRAMVDILDMVNPEAMGFSKRIRNRVLNTGRCLGIKPLWQLELAVMLSHIGCVALPAEIILKMDQGIPLTPEEEQMFGMHPNIAATLLKNINKMDPVAKIIKHQHETLNKQQPLGSRIIKVALDVDRLERTGKKDLHTLEDMLQQPGEFDRKVVECMRKQISQTDIQSVKQIDIEELKEGMIMARDLVNNEGAKLLLRGQTVSKASENRLKSFHIALGIIDPIHIVDQS